MSDEIGNWVVEERVDWGWKSAREVKWVSGNGESKWLPEVFETRAQAEIELQWYLEKDNAAYEAGNAEYSSLESDYRIVRRYINGSNK